MKTFKEITSAEIVEKKKNKNPGHGTSIHKKPNHKKPTRKDILRQRNKKRKEEFDKEDLAALEYKNSMSKHDKEFNALLQKLMGEIDD